MEERTARFGEAIIDFAKSVPVNVVSMPLISQIVRSGTSVGANYCEADEAVSKKEFRQKIGTCLKESKETRHWLRMIVRAEPERKCPRASSGRKQKNSFSSLPPFSENHECQPHA